MFLEDNFFSVDLAKALPQTAISANGVTNGANLDVKKTRNITFFVDIPSYTDGTVEVVVQGVFDVNQFVADPFADTVNNLNDDIFYVIDANGHPVKRNKLQAFNSKLTGVGVYKLGIKGFPAYKPYLRISVKASGVTTGLTVQSHIVSEPTSKGAFIE